MFENLFGIKNICNQYKFTILLLKYFFDFLLNVIHIKTSFIFIIV